MKRKRARLHREQGGKCAYCRNAVHESDATVDHLLPHSKGGSNEISNLVMSCKRCNLLLADFTSVEDLEAHVEKVSKLIAKKQRIIDVRRKRSHTVEDKVQD